MTYNPWRDLAARTDITFGVTRLPVGDAWWLPTIRGIAIDDRLSRIERRCALAHELVHADHNDDQCAGNGSGARRIARQRERHADEIAARRLIRIDALADALRWALGVDEVADVLDVTQHLVRVRLRGLTEDEKTWIDARIDTDQRGIA